MIAGMPNQLSMRIYLALTPDAIARCSLGAIKPVDLLMASSNDGSFYLISPLPFCYCKYL